MLTNDDNLKDLFRKRFYQTLSEYPLFKLLMYDIFTDGTAYIVGGYFRDTIKGLHSRDIDIIVDINHKLLLEKISTLQIPHSINRHNGIKLDLATIKIDIWSIENNWAFKENLVKLNSDDKIKCIAEGCFYNYDALVINLNSFNYNIRYYKEFEKKQELRILRKSSLYRNLNPTIEANILRAFYLRKKFNISYTNNTKEYLIKRVGYLNDNHNNSIQRLVEIKTKYQKYNEFLSRRDILLYINELYYSSNDNEQLFFKF
ncbi:hypothetical protein [Rufibacter quisquiliarum]|uniref:tRNA nucleotidyltransferase/poly(A) polymerase n=1 Tax=Rufibacter quisquiliarum TaxID=1549639 RepID=A0A839GLI9_9BACT|nr:hypothetical protein [Rufibacter quisquiliarum]MBA9079570.1 tRNA nucleotidyltransferase/poly(A) polymerase [Rufibacter quisquiliarum]